MLCNNLDPQNAENPDELIVYGGTGRAARSWPCFDAIVECLLDLGDDETLLVQSGKPVGVLRTHCKSPRVLIANSNLVPRWARTSRPPGRLRGRSGLPAEALIDAARHSLMLAGFDASQVLDLRLLDLSGE